METFAWEKFLKYQKEFFFEILEKYGIFESIL
jgi:hypothetical protein